MDKTPASMSGISRVPLLAILNAKGDTLQAFVALDALATVSARTNGLALPTAKYAAQVADGAAGLVAVDYANQDWLLGHAAGPDGTDYAFHYVRSQVVTAAMRVRQPNSQRVGLGVQLMVSYRPPDAEDDSFGHTVVMWDEETKLWRLPRETWPPRPAEPGTQQEFYVVLANNRTDRPPFLGVLEDIVHAGW